MNQTRKNDSSTSCCCGGEQGTNTCCGADSSQGYKSNPHWIAGSIKTPVSTVLQVATALTFADTLGSWKARWGINRMNYKVSPGLYCVGQPNGSAPVFVTGNYKLSFDILRRELAGRDAWLLVLDTKGINNWCAAGKGTFGTDELASRIAFTNLAGVVSHRTVILPQLGAPGVAAHEVLKRSGFQVLYGPVRASDLPAFWDAGMKATAQMRQVKFDLYDRLVLTPIELVGSINTSLVVFGMLFMLNLLQPNSFGFVDFYGYIGALLVGCFFVPVLLPWIPGKAFAWKGWLLGLVWAAGVNVINGWPAQPEYGWLKAISYMLLLPAVSSYYAMNFTGCSTFTSPSGVLKEMKTALPCIGVSLVVGTAMLLLAVFSGWGV